MISQRENRENWIIVLSLALTIGFSILDISSDVAEGATALHLIGEGLITTITFVGFVFIWRRTVNLQRELSTQKLAARQAIKNRDEAMQESARWRKQTATVLQGLSAAIDDQLCSWNLTTAEKEVALLLLKGLSLKEVADVRAVSEKTARAQSFSIYAKSGLAGRAELSAFFLEDLMLPLENSEGLTI